MKEPITFDSSEITLLFNLFRSLYDTGHLTLKEFETALRYFKYYDTDNNLWTIGVQSGEWYRRENDEWIPGSLQGRVTQAWTRIALNRKSIGKST